jgi:hypothetical protein
LKNLTSVEKFERMEYICDKIIPIVKFENLNIYFKTKIVERTLGWIFYGVWYWYTSIKPRKALKFKVFGWNSL